MDGKEVFAMNATSSAKLESMTQYAQVRHNYLAIVVAGLACFLLAGGWFTFFQKPWLDGVGRTKEWLMGPGGNGPALQYGTALVSALVVAAVLSYFIQLTGPQTALRGVRVGVTLWFGMVLTTWATEYAFEARPLSLLGINAGFWLFSMAMMGAIVGAWKKR
jgi:hypothetical protein